MRERISTYIHQHPWLATIVALYLLLSGIEVTRNLLLARPLDGQDAGFSSWQEMQGEDLAATGPILFRWAESRSSMVRPVHGPVLGLLVIVSGTEPAPVTFAIDGQVIDAYSLTGAGAYSFRYYLPPILGAKTWSAVEEILAQQARTRAAAANGPWLARWQELRPWHLPPEPPTIGIETALASAPDGPAGGADVDGRRAGIGIASVEWLDEVPAGGAGFHPPETDVDGIEYRWTRRWASLPLSLRAREAVVRIRAIHPDIARLPVAVDFFWGTEMLRTVSLSTSAWTDVAVRLPAEAARDGVLSMRTGRTWSPARAGVSADTRELGVAVATVTWR